MEYPQEGGLIPPIIHLELPASRHSTGLRRVGALGSAVRAGIDLVPRYRIALQAQGIMAKPKRVTKALDKSNSQRIIETLLMFAPAPIRAIASSPLGSRIIMTLGAGLLATGAMSVDWKNGIPQLQFHKDKIGDATQNIADEMDKQSFTWSAQQQPNWPPPPPQQNWPQQNYPPQNWPPQVPQQNYPPQNYPPQVPQQNYPQQNYPPQNYPPVFPPTQNGSTLPPGYGYGQAQNPAYPPGYYR